MLATLGACSSGSSDKNSSAQASGGGGSQIEYCAAVKSLVDLTQQFSGSTVPNDEQNQMADELSRAAGAAPSEVSADFQKALAGDTYAGDNVNQYNKAKCGVDTSSVSPSSR
jgi:hypothetical protein